jgi:hypothetical protein
MFKKWQSSLRRFSQIWLQQRKALMILPYVWLYNENHMYESDNFLTFFSLSLLGTENMQKYFFPSIFFFCFFISLSGDICPVRKGW